MTDFKEIQKDLYEEHHETFNKLQVSELKDQILEKNAEIESLQIRIRDLERMLGRADFLLEQYRANEKA